MNHTNKSPKLKLPIFFALSNLSKLSKLRKIGTSAMVLCMLLSFGVFAYASMDSSGINLSSTNVTESSLSKISLNITQNTESGDVYTLNINGINETMLRNSEYELWMLFTNEAGVKQESKYFGMLTENIVFSPKEDGTYIFRLYNLISGESICTEPIIIKSVQNFNLEPVKSSDIGSQITGLNTNYNASVCEIFRLSNDTIINNTLELGESVDIFLEVSTITEIYIIHNSTSRIETFMLRRNPQDLVPTFIPPESGTYTVTVSCSNSTSQSISFDVISKSVSSNSTNDIGITQMVDVMDSKGTKLTGSINLYKVRKENVTRANPLIKPISNIAKNMGLESVGNSMDQAITVTSEENVAEEASVSLEGLDGFENSRMNFRNLGVDSLSTIKIENVP
jgi:hypothetical protein